METNLKEFAKNNVFINYLFGPDRKVKITGISGVFNIETTTIEDYNIYQLYTFESGKINVSKLAADSDDFKKINKAFIQRHDYIAASQHYVGETNGCFDGNIEINTDLENDEDGFNTEISSFSKYIHKNKAKNSEEYTETFFCQELNLPDKFYFQILFPFTRVSPLILITEYKDNMIYDYKKHFVKEENDRTIFNSMFDTKYEIYKYEKSNFKNLDNITINNPNDIAEQIKDIYEEDFIEDNGDSFTHKNFRNGIDYSYTVDREAGIIEEIYSIDSFILEKRTSAPNSFTNYHKFTQIFDEKREKVKEYIDIMDRDLAFVDSIPESVLKALFKFSTIYEESEIDNPDIIKYENDEEPEVHCLYVKQWPDDGTYLFTSKELLEGSSNESEENKSKYLDDRLSYSVEIFGDGKYMREVYTYNEGTNNVIVTDIFDCEDERCIYTLNQTLYNSLFETKLVSEYDNDGLRFRIINSSETSISGSPKSSKFTYESPELNIEIDETSNTVTNFSSSLFNISDSYVFVRDIYGNMKKLDLSYMNK